MRFWSWEELFQYDAMLLLIYSVQCSWKSSLISDMKNCRIAIIEMLQYLKIRTFIRKITDIFIRNIENENIMRC